MNSKPTLYIRADATPKIGSGHIMRCLALAQNAKKQNIAVHLWSKLQIDWVHEKLKQEKIPFTLLTEKIEQQENPEKFLTILPPSTQNSWVILDNYHFNLGYQQTVQKAGYRLLLIDDCNHLPEYSCDILLNQNISAKTLHYNGKIKKQLLGLQYALLRQEFLTAKKQKQPANHPPKNILFTLGGGDFSHLLPKLANDFALPEIKNCTLRIVTGSMPTKKIRTAFANCPAQIEIIPATNNMAELFCWADICITSAGSTCWELCYLEIPFLMIEIADNQKEELIALEKQNIAQRFTKENLTSLLTQTKIQKQYSIVDGLGAKRVTDLLLTNNTTINI